MPPFGTCKCLTSGPAFPNPIFLWVGKGSAVLGLP